MLCFFPFQGFGFLLRHKTLFTLYHKRGGKCFLLAECYQLKLDIFFYHIIIKMVSWEREVHAPF